MKVLYKDHKVTFLSPIGPRTPIEPNRLTLILLHETNPVAFGISGRYSTEKNVSHTLINELVGINIGENDLSDETNVKFVVSDVDDLSLLRTKRII